MQAAAETRELSEHRDSFRGDRETSCVQIWGSTHFCPLIGDLLGFPDGASGKELACQCRRNKRRGFDPWVEKISWRRKWKPTPVFLFGESHGQRSLASYSPGVAKNQTRLKQLSTYTHIATEICTECFSLKNKQLTWCWCLQSQMSKRE